MKVIIEEISEVSASLSILAELGTSIGSSFPINNAVISSGKKAACEV
jgi:hypothetical protein